MENNSSVNYSNKFSKFMVKCDNKYKEQFPDVMDKLKGLYIPLFQMMDEAKKRNIYCNIKEIINTAISSVFTPLLMLLSDVEVNEIITELQNDVDLILEKGFDAFENKILDMFIELEKEDEKFANLMKKFDDLHVNIKKYNKKIST